MSGTPATFWAARRLAFEKHWEIQQAQHTLQAAPIVVKLADGRTELEGTAFSTTPLDLAKRISGRLAREALVARVDSELWDLQRPLETNCQLELLTWEDPDAQRVFWHSSAHVLGYAMEKVFGAILSTGPPLDEGGFFYEGRTGRPVEHKDYDALRTAFTALVKEKVPFRRIKVSKEEVLEMFAYNEFKSTTLSDKIADGGYSTVYQCGDFVDPCRGPHVPSTSLLRAFSVTKNSSAYFRGDKNQENLQRVYGISFPKPAQLKEWTRIQEEAAKRDHRVIGRQQELFFFHEVSPGSAFFLPHGTRIYKKLIEFQEKNYRKRGYDQVLSPTIFNKNLWVTSGHWSKYRENMYLVSGGKSSSEPNTSVTEDEELLGMKSMNCPGHCMLFSHSHRSYRELPVRIAEEGVLHRNELAGALSGLTRVRRFIQDDAHIFCRMDQVKEEIVGVLDFLFYVYRIFGFHSFVVNLSTRPENFIGRIPVWDEAEIHLRDALNMFCGLENNDEAVYDGTRGCHRAVCMRRARLSEEEQTDMLEPWVLNPREGAFYGPKIDVMVEDAARRKHQMGTIQLDFNLPERFGLKYTAAHARADEVISDSTPSASLASEEDNPMRIDRSLDPNQERPVIIHRAIYGSFERCIAILCEHYGGKWPLWLSPRQIAILPVALSSQDYAQTIYDAIHAAGFWVELDVSSSTLNRRILEAQASRFNFIVVVGDRDATNKTIAVRPRDSRETETMTLEAFLIKLKRMISDYE